MNIYLVRHGQTDWNIQNRLQGKANIPLNEKGKEQAQILREKIKDLDIDLIISSPLDRALLTAEIINRDKKLPIITELRLQERSFGKMEGIKGDEYDKDIFWDYERNYEYEDVERIQDFFERISKFWDDIYQKYPDKNILVVTHNGVNIASYCYFYGGREQDLLSIKLDNCDYKKYEKQKDLSSTKLEHDDYER